MRRSSIAAVILATLVGAGAQGRAQVEDDTFLAFHSFWEARRFAAESGGSRCAVRAIHPAITQGEIFWIFNTDHRETLPHGYLSLDPRLGHRSAAGHAIIDGTERYLLKIGDDHSIYSRAEDAESLLAAMREGMQMSVILTPEQGERRELPLSLAGFTRASNAARAACEF